MSDMIMKQPDGGYHVADASNLTKVLELIIETLNFTKMEV